MSFQPMSGDKNNSGIPNPTGIVSTGTPNTSLPGLPTSDPSALLDTAAAIAAQTNLGKAGTAAVGALRELSSGNMPDIMEAMPEASPLVKAAVAAAQTQLGAAGAALENLRGEAPTDIQDILSAVAGGGGGTRTVAVSGPAVPPGMLTFVSLSGTESLNQLYSYTIQLKTPDKLNLGYFSPGSNLPLKPMVGKDLTVSIELDGGGKRHLSGLVTSAEVVGHQGRGVVYQLTLEPWLKLATHTSDYKTFQNKSVVDIIDEVLTDYPFPKEKRLIETYPKRVFQVQYGETDFNFLQRLMEEFGIYYYFEHSEGSHKLILIDAIGTHAPCPGAATLSFHQKGLKLDKEFIHTLTAHESLRTGKWVLDDFDFQKPQAKLANTVAKPRETGHPDYERYDWPGDYFDKSEGEFLTRVRMEAERALGSRAVGHGNVRTLATGYTFTLENCPTVDANREYLILETSFFIQDIDEHSSQGQSFQYTVGFTLQPTSEIYRPQKSINKPRTRGPQSAIVTGPAGEEIHTDQYGRITVHFLWDRYSHRDENSSCWIRVSQPWAGKGFGGMQIPRVGQEVLVDFKNGDPDLPIVVGRVYNADTMPPWGLPGNKTQSGMFSHTVGGGPDNANALRFEDKPGGEELWLHAEKDQRIEVNDSESHWVGNNRIKTIDNNETSTIGANRTHTVQFDETALVGQNKTVQVVNNLHLAAGDSITLTCGKSALLLHSSGVVALTCEQFNITAMQNGQINTKAGQLDLNMDERSEWIAAPGEGEKEEMEKAVAKIFSPPSD